MTFLTEDLYAVVCGKSATFNIDLERDAKELAESIFDTEVYLNKEDNVSVYVYKQIKRWGDILFVRILSLHRSPTGMYDAPTAEVIMKSYEDILLGN